MTENKRLCFAFLCVTVVGRYLEILTVILMWIYGYLMIFKKIIRSFLFFLTVNSEDFVILNVNNIFSYGLIHEFEENPL